MRTCLAAYTKLTSLYPGYLNVSQDGDGSIIVTVRGDPETFADRSYICGHATDKGWPGRCTPGDEHCNNYCNLAPEKGPMQDHPLPCSQTFEGKTATVRLSAEEWDGLLAEFTKGK